jgi:hypothetical protein
MQGAVAAGRETIFPAAIAGDEMKNRKEPVSLLLTVFHSSPAFGSIVQQANRLPYGDWFWQPDDDSASGDVLHFGPCAG